MHHNTFKKAVETYSKLAAVDTRESVEAQLIEKYPDATPEEIQEVMAAIYTQNPGTGEAPQAPAASPAKPKVKGKLSQAEINEQARANGYIVCEEWRMEIANGQFEKLKLQRTNVKLTPRVFEELNSSARSTMIQYFEI